MGVKGTRSGAKQTICLHIDHLLSDPAYHKLLHSNVDLHGTGRVPRACARAGPMSKDTRDQSEVMTCPRKWIAQDSKRVGHLMETLHIPCLFIRVAQQGARLVRAPDLGQVGARLDPKDSIQILTWVHHFCLTLPGNLH